LYCQVTADNYFGIPDKTIFVSFYMLITDGDCECLIVLTGFPVQFGLFIRTGKLDFRCMLMLMSRTVQLIDLII